VRSELLLYHRLVVQLTWDDQAVQTASANSRGVSPAYEEVLRTTLLNYAGLTRPSLLAASTGGAAEQQAEEAQAGSVLKIGLGEDGVYKLGYTDLVNAGFDPATVDPRKLKMTNQGAEIPIKVEGETDGRFDSTDFILFYGTAIRSPYTTQNIYWLSAGAEAGLRMEQRNAAPAGNAPSPLDFLLTHHAEEDTVYWQNLPGKGEDRWFWQSRISPNTQGLPAQRAYEVVLGQLSPAATTATIRVRLQGYTGLGHRTRIYLNDQVVDEQSWQGQVQFEHNVTVSHSLLRSGKNIVRVEAVESGAVVDQLLLNWIEIDYWNRYEARDDQLLFGAPVTGPQEFAVAGFTHGELTVLDVSDPAQPRLLVNPLVERDGERFRLRFAASLQSASRFFALTSGQYKSPTSISLDQPSSWKSPNNGADYIIITHEDFYDSALALAGQRSASGLRVATIPVGDLYDEFNNGIFDPAAIRMFLHYAYTNWAAPAPTYVVLFGDAYQDYKDNLKTGTHNYVPSQTIDSELFGEVSSDNWFVTVSGDDNLPDLLVGRLSAQNRQDAEAIVAKLIQYDQQPADESWNKRVLLVADDDEAIFQSISEQLASRLPYDYAVRSINVADYPPGNPRADIISQINDGSVLVNYAGHGEFFGWGRWNQEEEFIFQQSDIDALHNANKLPVITVGDCLNGFFAGPQDRPALAESLQRQPNAGAIGVWAPTGYGYATGHRLLLDEFYRAIFVDDQPALGAATTAAKLATYAQSSFWGELVDTYLLFGDPATQLAASPNLPYIKAITPAHGVHDVALDQAIQVVFSKPIDPQSLTLESGAASVSFTPAWNGDFTAVSLLHTGFNAATEYELLLYGQDQHGNRLRAGPVPNPWSFSTTTDSAPPGASIMAPGNEDGAVLATAPIIATFSEPVRTESVTYSIIPYLHGSLHWESTAQRVVFVHDRFQTGQIYTFSLLTATDRAGNRLPGAASLSFTVEETGYTHLPLVLSGE
jgi:hypothetical protein